MNEYFDDIWQALVNEMVRSFAVNLNNCVCVFVCYYTNLHSHAFVHVIVRNVHKLHAHT